MRAPYESLAVESNATGPTQTESINAADLDDSTHHVAEPLTTGAALWLCSKSACEILRAHGRCIAA